MIKHSITASQYYDMVKSGEYQYADNPKQLSMNLLKTIDGEEHSFCLKLSDLLDLPNKKVLLSPEQLEEIRLIKINSTESEIQ